MKLCNLLKGIETKERNQTQEEEEFEIEGVCTDSTMIKKGDLFIALKGGTTDGHSYMGAAQRRGAAAIVCERKTDDVTIPQIVVPDTRKAYSLIAANFFENPQREVKIIGVTGTNGKTTTSHYLASILRFCGKKVGLIGTLGTFYGEEEYSADLTTPDPIRLFALLAEMKKNGVEYVVMEVSAHAIYYKKTYAIRFAACIFTNCTQDHLDFFGTMENYKNTKKELFECGEYDVAVINVDDPLGAEIGSRLSCCIPFSLRENVMCHAKIESEDETGSSVEFFFKEESIHARLRLCGRYNVKNALAAASCAYALSMPLNDISDGLEKLEVVKGRLEFAEEVNGGKIFVDFAHTPDGLENALLALKNNCRGRLFCAFGCGGDRDRSKRSLMGEIAGKLADFCVLTSDNPRYEEPYSIISEIEKGYRKVSRNYVVVQDRRKGIEYAMRRLRENDVLLIAGKGDEDYQEIMGIKYAYNDNAVVKEISARIRAEKTE